MDRLGNLLADIIEGCVSLFVVIALVVLCIGFWPDVSTWFWSIVSHVLNAIPR